MTESRFPVQPAASAATDALGWLTLYLVILFTIPSRMVIPALGSAGAPSMAIGLVSLLIWSLNQLRRPRSHLTPVPPAQPVRQAVFMFLLCVGTSYVFAMTRPINGDEVSPADVAILSVLSWSGTLLLTSDGLKWLESLRTLARRLAWAGGILGLLGLAQFLTHDILIDRLVVPGLRTGGFEVFERNGFVRPSGTATHPIEFGIILAMMLPFALHLGYRTTSGNRYLRWIPAVLLGISIALTFSRSAYLSVAVAVLILLIGWPQRRRLSFGAVLAAMAVALFVSVPRLFGTINSLFRNVGNDPSIESRTESYELAFQFIAQAPWFGRGLGTFLPKYRIFDNQYLLLLVTIGVVGTLALLYLFFTSMRVTLVVARQHGDADVRDLALSLLAAISAGAFSLATFDAFAFPMTLGALFLLVGMAGALWRLERPGSTPSPTEPGAKQQPSVLDTIPA